MSAAVAVRSDRRTSPDRAVLIGAGWRAALVVVAALAVALEAPAWVRLPLSAAAVLGVATFFLRRYGRRGLLDVVLVVAGGGLVALALLGLLLNLLPAGLDAVSWGVAVGVLELAVLAFLAVFRSASATPPSSPPRDRNLGGVGEDRADTTKIPVAGLLWGVGAAAILGGAIVYSTVSFTATHVPPLAVAAVPHGDSVTVSVSSGTAEGPFALELVTADGRTTLASSIEIMPGHAYTKRIALPDTRAVLQLVPAGSTAPVRELILDDSAAVKATTP